MAVSHRCQLPGSTISQLQYNISPGEHTFRLDIGCACLYKPQAMIEIDGGYTQCDVQHDGRVAHIMQILTLRANIQFGLDTHWDYLLQLSRSVLL